MVDQKTTDLTAITTFSGDELFYVVEDDDGTPVSRKVTVEDLATGLAAQAGMTAVFAPLQTAVLIPAGAFVPVNGSPVLGDGGSDVPGFLLDAAATERVAAVCHVPSGWNTYNAIAVWSNAGAGSGDVVLQFAYKTSVGDGDSAVHDAFPANVTATAPAQNTAEFTTMESGIAVPSAGEFAAFRMARVGSDGADTLANDIVFIGLRLARAS